MAIFSLDDAVSRFGKEASAKLKHVALKGGAEDQLRAPLETLIGDLALLSGFKSGQVVAIGEAQLSDLKTRPDYAITVNNALVGFIEVKAPGKGADPRRFKDPHDRGQWDRLQSIPNLMYTDGNAFSLWRDGEIVGAVVAVDGDVETSGPALRAPVALLALFEDFLRWEPIAPRTAKQLAAITARLCRLLRDEVIEQLERGDTALTLLAQDWRKLLFPDASLEKFADGYAQAVTFGMLMARARGFVLATGLDQAAKQLGATDSLIGTALRLLTDNVASQKTLQTSLGTLVRVLDVVHWPQISKGATEAWLYFYEDFLETYDSRLRKQTGSYYTPPEVVEGMVRLVNDVLRTRFASPRGLAETNVTIVDPAVGTGTYLLSVLRRIAEEIKIADGDGVVPAAINAAVNRLIGFELQLGPYAVAQLRLVAAVNELTGAPPNGESRLFVADTLANPWAEQEQLGSIYEPIAESRRRANEIKRDETITVVIGNPPYKEKAKGRGGWVENGGENHPAPLADWALPPEWGAGVHARHLRNLYIYFWRWATWKVFDSETTADHGIVNFISAAGFLNGAGFQKMREYMRRTTDEIWVIDCSPEGHRPDVSSRIFEDVQQPICIVLASRSPGTKNDIPASVRYIQLPAGNRNGKFSAISKIELDVGSWEEGPTDWRAPFLPALSGEWASFPPLDNLFVYKGTGVMVGRTWVIAPDQESLKDRWRALQQAPATKKEALFHPHLQKGQPGDRHLNRKFEIGLAGTNARTNSVGEDKGQMMNAIRYAHRSFDRQWIIGDYRLINRPNPTLWTSHSGQQIYITAPEDTSPTAGPALTVTSSIPDVHHYNGRGGRVYPLWQDSSGKQSNVRESLLTLLEKKMTIAVSAHDVVAYVAAVAAHPAYTSRFANDLSTRGLRIPLTANAKTWKRAVELGERIIWLHTYGERAVNVGAGRASGSPRHNGTNAPTYPRAGAIPSTHDGFPDTISYDAGTKRLHIGAGFIENVDKKVWEYEVSGKKVIRQWFSSRKLDRERPLIGEKRAPSLLGDIQPASWLPEYSTDLINLLHVLTTLVDLESEQEKLLTAICAGKLISASDVSAAEEAFAAVAQANAKPATKAKNRKPKSDPAQTNLID